MQVPLRPVPPSALHSMAKPGATVHVHGVCTAVESVQKRVACRVVRCPHCEAVQTHLLGTGMPLQTCCPEASSLGSSAWEEDVTGRMFVPVSSHYPNTKLMWRRKACSLCMLPMAELPEKQQQLHCAWVASYVCMHVRPSMACRCSAYTSQI